MGTEIDYDAVIAEVNEGWCKDYAHHEGKSCLLGAADKAGVGTIWLSREVEPIIFEHFAERITGSGDVVVLFNDHPDTTVDDVILVLEKARAH